MNASDSERAVEINVAPGQRLRGLYADGPGPVGVFVHGYRSSLAGEKSAALAAHARRAQRAWLRVDLRGHGRSDGEFSGFRLSQALADVEAILSWLGRRPVVLVGSSMGGWLAVLAAQRRPARVRGMLLIAPAFNFIAEYLARLPPEQRDAWRTAGRRTLTDLYDGTRYTLDYEVLADADALDVQRDGCPRFDCPVEIVHGERDEVVPVDTSRRFLGWLGRGRLAVVAGADHRVSAAVPLMCERIDALWEAAGGGP